MTEEISKVIAALERNSIKGLYAENSAEACRLVRELLPKGAVISSGGSVSLMQSGVYDIITGSDYNYLDRTSDPEAVKKAFTADYYFMGCNAVTADGVLYNVDGYANRVSALAFGPSRVIIIAGINKIVKDLDEAVYRVKTVAAPLNAKRLGCDTYCAKTGRCVSLLKEHPQMSDGCDSEKRICCTYTVAARQRIKDRITVIIVNEELGL